VGEACLPAGREFLPALAFAPLGFFVFAQRECATYVRYK